MSGGGISAAARTLREELHDVAKLGDLLIDTETGEVHEWGEVSGDKFEHLTLQAMKAQANIAGWEQALAIYKRALGRMLDQADQRSIRTPYGTPRWASRVDHVANPDRVPQVVEHFELGREIEGLIWMTAKALGHRKLQEMADNGIFGQDVVRALVEDVPRGPWIVIDPPKEQAPEIIRQ